MKIEKETEKLRAASASTAGEGKRGSYITAKVRDEIAARVHAEALAACRPENVAEDEWQKRLQGIIREMPRCSGRPDAQQEIMAGVVLAEQYVRHVK